MNNKLLSIQTELKAPKNQRNNFGNYNYRSCEDILEALKPLLEKNKVTLWLDDEMVLVGNRVYVKATATFIDGDLTTKAHGWAREEETKKGMDASQITGAASSYARKYALNALFLIDDNKDSDATNNHQEVKETAKPESKAKPEAAAGNAESSAPIKERVIGKIKDRKENNGWVKYLINNFVLSTKKGDIIDVMDKCFENKNDVQVDYTTSIKETEKGKFYNHYIDKVEVMPLVPF